MKTNLSSQIKLDRIPRRYYDPQGEIELAALTREEKIYTKIFESANEGSQYLAQQMVRTINRAIEKKGKAVIALGAGNCTQSAYTDLIELYREGKIDFDKVVVFNLCEFFPLVPGGPSTLARLHEVLLDHVNIRRENIRSIDLAVNKEDMYQYCKAYEQSIADEGGLDLVVCEVGPQGCLAFNEPGSPATSLCRLVLMSNELRQYISRDYKADQAPATAVTLGIANILSSDRILSMAWGEKRAAVIRSTVEEHSGANVPASFLQGHPHTKLVLDLAAAEDLTRISQPWKVTSCEWNDKLIRRAIVWLCHETGKPILKLTDKDYSDYG
ncbi:MAG: 6-phosphogluconolactonase, partial [Paramuribaculum sp.]|nr:6-phosphogluconolactonase [Paramuribaculum sp.]